MEFFLFLALVVGAVWLCVGLKYFLRKPVNPIPVASVVLLVVASVFGAEFFRIEAAIPITIDRLMLGGLAVTFAMLIFLGYDRIRPINRTDVLVYGLFGWMALSTFAHDWGTHGNLPVSRLLFFNFFPLLLYTIVRHSRLSPKDLKMISLVLGGFGFYLALTGVFEVLGFTGLIFPAYISDATMQEFFGRARGPFLNPISNGVFLIVGLGAMLIWWNHVSTRVRFLFALATPIFVIAIVSTLTRSVWLSLALAMAVVVLLAVPSRLRARAVFVSAICGCLALVVVSQNFSQFKRDKYVSEADMKMSATLRPLFAVVAYRMFQDRPVLGHGFGQYSDAKMPYLQDSTGKYSLALTKSYMQHNLFLAYLTELGLIGVSLLILLLVNLSTMAIAIWNDVSRHLFARYFALLGLVIVICHVTNGMFHDVSIAPMINMFLYFLIGVLTNLFTTRESFAAEPAAQPAAWPTSGLLVDRLWSPMDTN